MTSPVSAIEAIEKAMEGVTPGQWYPGHLGTDSTCQCRSIVDEGIYMGAIATVHVDNGLPIGEGGNDAPPAEEAAANMRYIAACNPVAISELLALARKAEALQRENAEKDTRIAALEAGIRPFSKFAGVVFERNFNSSDPVDTMTASDGAVSTLYARDFFSARALLGGENADH